jgi:ribosomal-protein-alanine N-acetyltransferase
MPDDRLPVIVRRMTLDDIDEVTVLDRLAFPTPWPARTYRYEILNNDNSTMLVLEKPNGTGARNDGSLAGWVRRVVGQPQPLPNPEMSLYAYSGFWHIADEAHVSTIAVHPDWRGHRLGELLIWTMAHEAIRRNATMVTLEVRVTNTVAQNLYRKYGFAISGRRKGYYRDNGEDAYMMTVTPLDDAYRVRLKTFGQELAKHLHVISA